MYRNKIKLEFQKSFRNNLRNKEGTNSVERIHKLRILSSDEAAATKTSESRKEKTIVIFIFAVTLYIE